MAAQYDTAEDRALRLYAAADLDQRRAEYLAMSADQRLAYAQAHPGFTLTNGGAPQALLLAMAALHDAGEPDQAAALAADHRAAELAQDAARILAAQAMSLPERTIMAGAWLALTAPLAGICALTGYLAGGPHTALVAACPAACLGVLAMLRRLVSPVR